MTHTLTSPTIDPSALDMDRTRAFVGQVLVDLAGASTAAMIITGDRLGLYEALAHGGPVTPRALAETTGLHERLVAEWLAAQAVSGYLTYDPAAGTYCLPAEHAMVLAVSSSPAYVVGAAEVVAGQYATLGLLESAFRGDGSIAYADFPATVAHGIERFFSTAYTHQLVDSWFPAVDGLVARLSAGARVADVGCGHGAATLLMAEQWPRSTFVGFDQHEPSVTVARSRAVSAGTPRNVSFEVADAGGYGPGPYDVVVFFDALHDLGDPPAALRRAAHLLTPGGYLVAVEPWSSDRLEEAIGNPVARLNLGVSTSMCTPTSLAQPGTYGMGTSGGPTARLRLLQDAGFEDARVAIDTGQNIVLAARSRKP